MCVIIMKPHTLCYQCFIKDLVLCLFDEILNNVNPKRRVILVPATYQKSDVA